MAEKEKQEQKNKEKINTFDRGNSTTSDSDTVDYNTAHEVNPNQILTVMSQPIQIQLDAKSRMLYTEQIINIS